jgi:hypothetical protein
MPDQTEVLEHHPYASAEAWQHVARGIGKLLAKQGNSAACRTLREVQQFQE